VILGVVFSVTLAEQRALAQEKLTELQMDSITAGTVAVSVSSSATAAGDSTYAYITTNTYTSSKAEGFVEIGKGSGEAYACCSPSTDADVSTGAYADGDAVLIASREYKDSTLETSFINGEGTVSGESTASGNILVTSFQYPH
jgi:hypothetical protein